MIFIISICKKTTVGVDRGFLFYVNDHLDARGV